MPLTRTLSPVLDNDAASAAADANRLPYESLFSASIDAIVVADDDARYVDVNPAACELFGLTRGEILRRRVPDIAPPEMKDAAEQQWMRFLETGTQLGEFRLSRPDGEVRIVEFRAKANIVPGRHLSILRDVTDHRRLEAAAIQDRARLAAVLDHLPVGVLIADARSGRLVYGNRKYEEHIRHRFEPMTLAEYAEAVPRYYPGGRRYEWPDFPLARALAGELVDGDEPIIEVDGERVILRVSAAPLFSEMGAVTAAVATFEDVSAEKRLHRERAENERTREVFVGALGHDLRNPLAAIATNAEAARRVAPLPVQVADSLERILRSAGRMSRMIADLLDFTRVRQGTMRLELEATDVGQLCVRTLDELEATHPGRIEPALETVSAFVDPDRLAQVVANLAANALRHGDGGPVRVALRGQPEGFEIAVHNAGNPIGSAEVRGLFDPFRSGRGAGSREGLGLGLFIVDHIVRAHGGKIEVESGAATGTTFRAVFPTGAPGSVPPSEADPPT